MKIKFVLPAVLYLLLFLGFLPQNLYAAEEDPYAIKLLYYNVDKKVVILKYNKFTGESWIYGKQGFVELKENKPIENSIFQVELVAVQQGWDAVRIDTRTGKTWTLRKKNVVWTEF